MTPPCSRRSTPGTHPEHPTPPSTPRRSPGSPSSGAKATPSQSTIVTTEATGEAGDIHDRTPLILPSDRIEAWLDPTLTDPVTVRKLMTSIELDPLEVRAVSTDVNKASTNTPALIDPLPEARDRPLQLSLAA